MATKAQHTKAYRPIPGLLREMREKAGLTQRELGERVGEPQSWVHNCEVGNRRVDLAEFVTWCEAAGVAPREGLGRYLKRV
jgi:transcriptional regulator with XRE-family HTH domain